MCRSLAGPARSLGVVAAVAPDLRPAGDAGTRRGNGRRRYARAHRSVSRSLLAARNGWLALLPALPLLVLAAPAFDDRPRLALLWVGAVAALVAATAWAWQGLHARRRRYPPGLNVSSSFSRCTVHLELGGRCEKRLHRLHRPGAESRRDGVAVDVRVLDDEVAPLVTSGEYSSSSRRT